MVEGDLRPDWNAQSQFRRYLLFPRPLGLYDCARLRDALKGVNLGPYLPWYAKGGVVLIPRRDDLEKFFLLPLERICFAKTARDPEHDAALVRVLGVLSRELRAMERERHLDTHSLGKVMCDDCGAHEEHRSRRMIANHWPVADGRYCAPWKGAWFNQTYGEQEENHDSELPIDHQDRGVGRPGTAGGGAPGLPAGLS